MMMYPTPIQLPMWTSNLLKLILFFPLNSILTKNKFSPIREKFYSGDSAELFDSNLLKEFNLCFNTRFGFLSCTECGFILTENLRNHLGRHHHKPSPELETLTSDLKEQHPPTQLPQSEEPIQGLKIVEGFQCNQCQFLSSTMNGIKTHWYSKHQGSPAVSPSSFQRRRNSNKIKV